MVELRRRENVEFVLEEMSHAAYEALEGQRNIKRHLPQIKPQLHEITEARIINNKLLEEVRHEFERLYSVSIIEDL